VNSILFSTLKGAPIAVLMLSSPATAERDCVFVVAAQDIETFNSAEGRVMLADRPIELPCRFTATPDGVLITFVNQKGWSFEVKLDRAEQGHWVARRHDVALVGRAASLTSLCTGDMAVQVDRAG
jgi:hypothetical protein